VSNDWFFSIGFLFFSTGVTIPTFYESRNVPSLIEVLMIQKRGTAWTFALIIFVFG
jgi:hypothetical protein